MTKGRLLQMSGVVVDLIYHVEACPSPGDEAIVNSSTIAAGGGFNAMISARRAGMDVSYGGAHGTGLFADLVRRELTDVGIPLLQPRSTIADQGSCVVLVDRDGERTFVSKEGAEGFLDEELLSSVHAAEFDWVLLSGYALAHTGAGETLGSWIGRLPDHVGFLFDPAPVVGRIAEPLLAAALSRAQWISANLAEAQAITGVSDAAASAKALSENLGAKGQGAVVRCGEAGCWVSARGRTPFAVEQFAVDTIDTNGAGDAHVGAFIAALSAGATVKEAAEYANAAAALSTTSPTPTSSHSEDDVKALMSRGSAKTKEQETVRDESVLVKFPAKNQ